MFKNHLFLISILASAVMGISTINAGASVEDNGAFFSDHAKSEAARNIADLERSVKKNLTIETFKELPEDIKKGANFGDKTALGRLFEEWTVKQARLEGINGVYILIVKTPPHLQVVVGNDTQKRAFTLHDRDTLVSMMLVKLRAKQNDEALLDGVSFVSSTMRAHTGGLTSGITHTNGMRHDSRSSAGWILPLVIGLLVVWVVVGIIRSLFGGRGVSSNPMSPGSPMSGGGGGFLSSMLGGMLGAGAGMWMYNQFFGDRGTSAFGAERENIDNGNGFGGQDTDYSSSGDTFGDNSGGGASGGDTSGGDIGGGDGGGDSGGGDF